MIKRGIWCITTVLMKILKKKKWIKKKHNIYSSAVLHDLFAHMAILKQLEHHKCTMNLRQHQTLQNAGRSFAEDRPRPGGLRGCGPPGRG